MEGSATERLVSKLNKDNLQFRQEIEIIKRAQKTKIDEIRGVLGIQFDLEILFKKNKHSKEM